MKIYTLHYAIIDNDGALSIDCKNYSSIKDAENAQNQIVNEFIENHNYMLDEMTKEEYDSFKRIAYDDKQTELQIHIEEFAVC